MDAIERWTQALVVNKSIITEMRMVRRINVVTHRNGERSGEIRRELELEDIKILSKKITYCIQ